MRMEAREGQDLSIDRLGLRQPSPKGRAPTTKHPKLIELRVDRACEALRPKLKDHTFCATPVRHLSVVV